MRKKGRTELLADFTAKVDQAGPLDDPAWRKAAPLVLRPGTRVEEALIAAVANALDHLSANEACVVARAHEEGVHQMRVACRRLRSRLAILGNVLPAEQTAHLHGELKWLISALAPARDWAVFLAETLKPAIERLPDDEVLALLRRAAEKQQDRGYRLAQAAIRCRRYAELKHWLAAWAGERRWWTGQPSAKAATVLRAPVGELAEQVLETEHSRVVELGAGLETMTAKQRHRLRIRVKKLRYAAELFASLYPEDRYRAYHRAINDLQDALGAMNDVEVARALVSDLVKKTGAKKQLRLAFAAGLAIGYRAAADSHEHALPDAWRRFSASPPFWR